MIRVFLMDDHEIVRRGIADLIGRAPGLEVVGESESAVRTLRRVTATLPDVAVLDVHLPDGSGIDVCRRIRSAHPEIHCLMLTAYADDEASAAAVLAGASGYIVKDIRGNNLVDAIRRVARGETLLAPVVVERVRASLIDTSASTSALSTLTLRERQALQLITEGMTNRQIGERLGLAEKTIKNYVTGLLVKLGMERRTQVAAYGATVQDESQISLG